MGWNEKIILNNLGRDKNTFKSHLESRGKNKYTRSETKYFIC